MPETKTPIRKPGMILLGAISAVFFTTQSWSQGIDWDGVFLDNGRSDSFNNRSSPRSNLPGVRTIPPTRSTNPQNNCNNGFSGGSQLGNSTVSSDGCNRKTPLIVIRDGKVDGLLFDFPR